MSTACFPDLCPPSLNNGSRLSDTSGMPNVLIVDDDWIGTTLLGQVVRSEGCQVKRTCFHSRFDRIVENFFPDLIIVAGLLADGFTLATLRSIRGLEALRGVPVVLHTRVAAPPGFESEARALGVAESLVAGMDADDVRERTVKYLSDGQPADATSASPLRGHSADIADHVTPEAFEWGT